MTKLVASNHDTLTAWSRENATMAVLFVHGWGGDGSDTWTNRESRETFPGLVVSDNVLPEFAAYSFTYQSGLKLFNDGTIENVVERLRTDIRDIPEKDIFVVAHSMGGLVTMRYIVEQLDHQQDPGIRGLVLYGTPLDGVTWVAIANQLKLVLDFAFPGARGVLDRLTGGRTQVGQMARTSYFLEELHLRWGRHVLNGGSPTEDVNRRLLMPMKLVTSSKDFVVEQRSARRLSGNIEFASVEYGHKDMVKPESHGDQRYRELRAFLTKHKDVVSLRVLRELQKRSETVTSLQRSPLVSEWKFAAVVGHRGTGTLAGFAELRVDCCSVRRLRGNKARIDFRFGRASTNEEWTKGDLIYVHAIAPNEDNCTPESIQEASASIAQLFDREDPETVWGRLFPSCNLEYRTLNQDGSQEPTVSEWRTATPGPPVVEANLRCVSCTYDVVRDPASNAAIELRLRFTSVRVAGQRLYTMFVPWLVEKWTFSLDLEADRPSMIRTFSSSEVYGLPKAHVNHRTWKVTASGSALALPGAHITTVW